MTQNMFGESKKSTSGACFCLSSGLSSGAMEHFMVGMSQKAPSVQTLQHWPSRSMCGALAVFTKALAFLPGVQ